MLRHRKAAKAITMPDVWNQQSSRDPTADCLQKMVISFVGKPNHSIPHMLHDRRNLSLPSFPEIQHLHRGIMLFKIDFDIGNVA